jgi:predicted transcriptional regulator
MTAPGQLSRRERQIMDIIYKQGRATAAEVLEQMPEPPSYSAVRAMLRVLEEKGHVKHKQIEKRYVFLPIVPRDSARRSALRHLLKTFFDGSREKMVAALLQDAPASLTDEELDRMAQLIEHAKKEGC